MPKKLSENSQARKESTRKVSTTTVSGVEVNDLYTPADLEGVDLDAELGLPGEPPYTRGIYPEMYRRRGWTTRPASSATCTSTWESKFIKQIV